MALKFIVDYKAHNNLHGHESRGNGIKTATHRERPLKTVTRGVTGPMRKQP